MLISIHKTHNDTNNYGVRSHWLRTRSRQGIKQPLTDYANEEENEGEHRKVTQIRKFERMKTMEAD